MSSADTPPPLTDTPRYPEAGMVNTGYDLKEGAGLWVFAVVASEKPIKQDVLIVQTGCGALASGKLGLVTGDAPAGPRLQGLVRTQSPPHCLLLLIMSSVVFRQPGVGPHHLYGCRVCREAQVVTQLVASLLVLRR